MDSQPEPLFTNANIVFTYTRAEAIADGVLVDLSANFPVDTRMFKWNVCCTEAVWNLIESAAETDNCEVGVYVWDVCFMAFEMISHVQNPDHPELFYKVCLPITSPAKQLKIVAGPVSHEDPTPCLTIMLPHED